MEQDHVARQWNFTVKWSAEPNLTVSKTTFKLFKCPSAPDGRRDGAKGPLGYGDYGTMNAVRRRFYTAKSVPNFPAAGSAADDEVNGAMAKGSDTPIVGVTDGTSNTILLAEDAGRPNLFQKGKDVGSVTGDGHGWADPDGVGISLDGVQADLVTTGGTCFINCTNDSEVYAFHSGGTNVLMADGSVRFVREGISAATFAALVTAAAGDLPGDF